MKQETESRLLELAGRLCDEQITEEEFSELDRILGADDEAREVYRAYLQMHQHLSTGALEAKEELEEKPASSMFSRTVIVLAGLAAAALVIISFLPQNPVVTPPPEVEPVPDFVLTRAIDIEWAHQTRFQAQLGQPITEKQIKIESGIAQVQFSSGATVTIEGPARLRLDDPMKCLSFYGKLTAFCPESAHGFMIRFPGGRVIDLGTEFALDSEEGGKTDVHVIDGEVIVERTDEEDKVLGTQNLIGQTAASIGGGDNIEEIAYDDASFSKLTRESMIRTQPIKLQFDLGHRAGLYKGTNAPAHAAGDMFDHEDTWTQIVGDQSGTFVMADGNVCPVPIKVDYGHGRGRIDWDATPVDPWGKIHSKAKGVLNTALTQDHRPWDYDLGLRVSGLPAGTYRIYALCRSVRRPEAAYHVSFGVNLKKQVDNPTFMPPMDGEKEPTWVEGETYAMGEVTVSGPEDWATFITRYSRQESVRSTPHHGRSVLLGLQILEVK